MTDRELMQMALDNLKWINDEQAVISYSVIQILRDRLAQPEYEFECPRCGHCCQQREWVGLTDEEYDELMLSGDWGGSLIQATQAKLKEKNQE
jgi:hypothetical protein